MKQLTEKQQRVYAYVAGYILDNGYSPTGQEIAERLHISPQAVSMHLKSLKEKGLIEFNGKKFRNVDLIPKIAEYERRK